MGFLVVSGDVLSPILGAVLGYLSCFEVFTLPFIEGQC